MKRLLLLSWLAAGAVAHAAPGAEELVREFSAAFNAHDTARMLAVCDPRIRWMSLSADSLGVEAAGAERLRAQMEEYFREFPSARSSLRSLAVNGAFVSTIEEASWTARGQERRQCSAAVYEVRDAKILRAWYFPPQPC